MIPKEQRLEFYLNRDNNDNNLFQKCNELIENGWVIHQIIPFKNTGSYHLLLYRY